MKRLLILGVLGMVVAMFGAAQDLQRGDATWYETTGISLRANHATLPFGTRIRVTNLNNNRQVIVTIGGRIDNEPGRILDISQEAAKNLEMSLTGGSKTPVTIEVLGGGRVVETPPPPPPEPEPEPPVVVAVAEPEPEPPPPPPPPPPPEPTPPPPPPPAPAPVEPRNLTIQTIININGSTVEVATKAIEGEPAPEPPPPPPPPPRFPPATVLPKMPDPGSGHIYRVQVGSYLSPLNAQNTFDRLKAAGFNPAYEKFEEYYRVVLSGVRAADMQFIAQQLGNQGVREVWIRQEY